MDLAAACLRIYLLYLTYCSFINRTKKADREYKPIQNATYKSNLSQCRNSATDVIQEKCMQLTAD